MRNRILGGLCLLWLCGLTTVAQRPDSAFYQPRPQVPAHLRGIERAGGLYFYGAQRLRSPLSLEIPFQELNDAQVMRHFRTSRTFSTASQLVGFVPVIYLLARNRSFGFRSREYWVIYFGSIGASLGLTLAGNNQVRRAVNRYNQVLLQSRLGVSMAPLPTGQTALGVGWSGRF